MKNKAILATAVATAVGGVSDAADAATYTANAEAAATRLAQIAHEPSNAAPGPSRA